MPLRTRPYTDADLPRLRQAVAGWIAAAGRCGYDHIGELPHRIYENLRGRRPVGELVQVWTSTSDAATPDLAATAEIAGVSICGRFGCAFDVLVAPELRGTAAELAMLRSAAAITGALSTEEYVNTDVFDCDTVRAACLRQLGFTRYRVWDDVLERPLADPAPDAVAPPGFTLRTATVDDADGLAEARNHSFGEDWTGPQYRDEVMRKPGYSPDHEVVAVAPDGRIAAFAVYWLDEHNRAGHLEPVGTHDSFRRLGLARAVMLDALARLRSAGMTTVSINHNADNEAAHHLYTSIGFTRHHETHGYRLPRPT